jgi:predicted nucleotidyltransferase
MRLSTDEREAIVEAIRQTFGAGAKTWLFGSRTDDRKRGGDIDLLVESLQPEAESVRLALQAIGRIQRAIGEQKIDLVVTDGSPEKEGLLIIKNARQQGVPL